MFDRTQLRFLSRVERNGPIARPGLTPCWMWQGAPTPKGRGTFKMPGRVDMVAARAAWTLFVGPITDPTMCVCHHCDVPMCVNWEEHLFLGTKADNLRDMYAKGRSRSQKVTHCPRGHEYTLENTYIVPSSGARYCRTCIYLRNHGLITTSSGSSTVS